MVALCFIVKNTIFEDRVVELVTIAFGVFGLVATIVVTFLAVDRYAGPGEGLWVSVLALFGACLLWMGLLGALYSDWVLVGITGNYVGVGGDAAVSIIYLIVKRLIMFSA